MGRFLVLAAMLVAVGCGDDEGGGGSTSDGGAGSDASQCASGTCACTAHRETCDQTAECCAGLVCAGRKCLTAVGDSCSSPSDCSTSECSGGSCACSRWACSASSDCCAGKTCALGGGKCGTPKGAACDPKVINDCFSQKCSHGTCACSITFCAADTDCCSGSCSKGGDCMDAPDGCKSGGRDNTTKVMLAYQGGPTQSLCGCYSPYGCDATLFDSPVQGTVRYTVGDAFNPTIITISFGGGNEVDVAVNETSMAIPSGLRGFYQNQNATQVTFTKMELMSGGIVDGSYNGVVLIGDSGSVTLSGTFHSIFP